MRSCPTCGSTIDADNWVGDLCPRCLFDIALPEDNAAARAATTSGVDFSPGFSFGHFTIIDLLGRGGMATVYSAYETELDRDVALKVLPPEFLHDSSFAKRFEREARLAAQLEHPHIVPIYASGIEHRVPWMSMRLMAGSLDQLLAGPRLDPARVVDILRGVAEGLDYAHAHGVVHLDIKPSNVLLDEDGRAYVGDFGLARVVERSLAHSQTIMAGTPQYMAPEQAMGHKVDAACDVYSLAIVAYEMLTGSVPFEAESPLATLMKHVNEPVRPPNNLPAPLVEALLKGLAKRPDERWPAAMALVGALEDALQGPPIVASSSASVAPSAASAKQVPWPRRLVGRRLGAASVVAALMVTVLAVASYFRLEPARLQPARPSTESASEAEVAFPTVEGPLEMPAETRTEPQPFAEPDDTDATRLPPPASGTTPKSLESRAVPRSEPRTPAILPDEPVAPPDERSTDEPAGTTSGSDPAAAPPLQLAIPTIELTPLPGQSAPRPPPIQDPTLLFNPDPVYPTLASTAGLEGHVVVVATVSETGQVTDARVLEASHPVFAEPARQAVLRYQYSPGLRNGTPDVFEVRIHVQFQLK